ncbi:MAG: peptidoglycan DD-metalloendopeptidase family protein [Bacilli bacterium]|nr:peptidoglycan DD-metalloendopeptidase family protein [Bacilli bacterium]
MKKIVLNAVKILLLIMVVFEYVAIIPVNAITINEEETLGDYKKALKKLEADAKAQKEKEKLTQSQINSNYNKYAEAGKEIEDAKNEVTELEKQITNTNEEIVKIKKDTAEILKLMQKLENENIYASYLSGSKTMTELVIRMNDINKITENNEKKLNSLELMISSNEKMSKKLVKYQDDLAKKMVEYEEKISDLKTSLIDIQEGAKDIDEEIAEMKSTIKMYENMGCKDADKLSTCIKVGNNAGWTKPLNRGVITSAFGYRIHPVYGDKRFHNGIDIGGNGEGTKIYAPATGVVAIVSIPGQNGVKSPRCGGKMVYLWVTIQNVKYTVVFMHLLDINVKEGQQVTTSTVIGTVGGGKKTKSWESCSTGAHLHYGVSKNNHYTADKTQTYSKFTANYINPPGFPNKNGWFYSR